MVNEGYMEKVISNPPEDWKIEKSGLCLVFPVYLLSIVISQKTFALDKF